MNINNFLMHIVLKYRRTTTKYLYRRMVKLNIATPIISFSFDDAPHTAFTHGGDILNVYGARATFYVSLGMLESDSPSGPIASVEDLRRSVKEGHELGCHTYDHKHSWDTNPDLFVQSVFENRQTLSKIFPEMTFSTLAYPFCGPRPAIKKVVGQLFQCCRSGGQTFNVGTTDLNLLNAYFLDARIGDTIDSIRHIIDKNAESNGWLIFATHDIENNPSPYGCSKEFFKMVVAHAAKSGALLLSVGKAFEHIQIEGQ